MGKELQELSDQPTEKIFQLPPEILLQILWYLDEPYIALLKNYCARHRSLNFNEILQKYLSKKIWPEKFFIEQIKSGDVAAAAFLLSGNDQDDRLNTGSNILECCPIVYAIQHADFSVVEFLLSQSVDVLYVTNLLGNSVLEISAARGDCRIFNQLLKIFVEHPKDSWRDRIFTESLQTAVLYGHYKIAEQLISSCDDDFKKSLNWRRLAKLAVESGGETFKSIFSLLNTHIILDGKECVRCLENSGAKAKPEIFFHILNDHQTTILSELQNSPHAHEKILFAAIYGKDPKIISYVFSDSWLIPFHSLSKETLLRLLKAAANNADIRSFEYLQKLGREKQAFDLCEVSGGRGKPIIWLREPMNGLFNSAAKGGNMAIIDRLFEIYFKQTQQLELWMNILEKAAGYGQSDLFFKMFERYEKTQLFPTAYILRLLNASIEGGDASIFSYLLVRFEEREVSQANSLKPEMLLTACTKGQLSIACKLWDAGVSAKIGNAKNFDAFLRTFSRTPNLDIFSNLLISGRSALCRDDFEHGCHNVMKYLLHARTNSIYSDTKHFLQMIQLLCIHGHVDLAKPNENSIFHQAVELRYFDVVSLFLELLFKQCDAQPLSLEQQRSLDGALGLALHSRHYAMMRLLLRKGANPNAFYLSWGSLFHVALNYSDKTGALLLLSYGAKFEASYLSSRESTQKKGFLVTLVQLDADRFHEVFRRLFENSSQQKILIDFALRCFSSSALSKLLYWGADLNLADVELREAAIEWAKQASDDLFLDLLRENEQTRTLAVSGIFKKRPDFSESRTVPNYFNYQ